MIEVSVHEAKTQLSRLLDLVQDAVRGHARRVRVAGRLGPAVLGGRSGCVLGGKMIVLLDTSPLLWTLADPDRLSAQARGPIKSS